jgi:hypothetical protein
MKLHSTWLQMITCHNVNTLHIDDVYGQYIYGFICDHSIYN